jgi:hypothetical protein
MRVKVQRNACSAGRGFGRKVIDGRPEAAGEDAYIGADPDFLKQAAQTLNVVPDRAEPHHLRPAFLYRLGNVGRIGVNQRTGADFLPGGDNFSEH